MIQVNPDKEVSTSDIANLDTTLNTINTDISNLNIKLTPKKLFDGDVAFTNGTGWISASSLSNTHCMIAAPQLIGANAPCTVSWDNNHAGVNVLLPISTGYSGTLRVILFGIGWN